MSNSKPDPLTSNERVTNAITAITLADDLLHFAGYSADSSARHNLAIAVSNLRGVHETSGEHEHRCECGACISAELQRMRDAENASEPLDRNAVNALALECAQASAIVRKREWNFDRYRNGRLMAQGVKVHAVNYAEAYTKAVSLLYIDGNKPTDELRLTENGPKK